MTLHISLSTEKKVVLLIKDIIHSQVNHYYMWGGRSVVHFIAQILLMLPTDVADLLHTSLFKLYLLNLPAHQRKNKK